MLGLMLIIIKIIHYDTHILITINSKQILMLSQSRISQATKQFLDTLNEVSNQIITYYFQSQTPTQPYKIKRHLTELYTFVYENCTSKPSYEEKMFETFKSALLRHLIKYMEILNESLKQNKVMKYYNLIWDSYKVYLRLLSQRIFSFLNRYYVPANDQESLIKVGLNIFSKAFLAETNVKVFINPYIREIEKLRTTKIISNQQLLHFSESLVLLDSTNLFPILKNVYMEEAAHHYKRVFEDHCNDEPMQYINYVNNLRYFEQMLAKNCICLTEAEEKELFELFNKELIKRYTHIFICHPYGFYFLLRKHQIENLKVLEQTFNKNEGFTELRKHLFDFINDEGTVVLAEKSKHISHEEFVKIFYDFYKDYHKLISTSFNKNTQMIISVNSAIEKLFLKFDRITEDLFKYVRDSLDNDNFSAIQEVFITIFEKLPYKDEFLSLYRASLERKVISGSAIYMIEKNFIEAINKTCNNQMTSDLSKILEDSIESMPVDLLPISHNFNVKVVSLYYWEKKFEDQISLNLTLVQPLASKWQQFQQTYSNAFPKRKLNLLPFETKITLILRRGQKQLTLRCNLLQACIIFHTTNNENQKIDETNLIHALAVEKTFIHRFIEDFPNLIAPDHEGCLRFNWNFQTVDSNIDLDFKVEEQKKVTRHIKQDRDILIQCAIVKIAKTKKKLTFEQLVQEVTHAIKLFRPHPSKIKPVLETLKKKDMVEEVDGIIYYKQ